MNKPRIDKVWIEVRQDESPDTSEIGEYTDTLEPGVIVRALREYVERLPEDAEIPDRGREYRAFKPYAGGENPGTAEYYKYGMQDFDRMEALCKGEWYFVGIIAKARIVSPHGVMQILSSGGLWGMESDAGEAYLQEVKQEELSQLRAELQAYGFGKRAIAYACRTVETVNK